MLITERRGDVLDVVLDRPDAYNAINPELREALVQVFDNAEADGVRAIVLRGNGRGFCAGADLKSARPATPGVATTQVMRMSTQKLVRSFLDCPVPVVSAVHGVAAGIGLTLALGADLCIAADDARFTPAFVQRAIVPDGGIAHWMPRLIGMALTKDFLMRGEPWSAAKAAELHLISTTVPADDLVRTAHETAEQLAQMPTVTLSLLKQMLAQSFETDLVATLLSERTAQGLSAITEDAAEGTRAFIEKRPAVFKGR
jgi:2-(1,2-epoxy-1,2-dihydrophenyl)acetyl-CoA isomerase